MIFHHSKTMIVSRTNPIINQRSYHLCIPHYIFHYTIVPMIFPYEWLYSNNVPWSMVISCYISYVSQWYFLYISIIPWDSLQHTRDTPMIPSLHHIRIPICHYSTSPLFHDPYDIPIIFQWFSPNYILILPYFHGIPHDIPFKLTSKIPLILSHQTYSHKICDHDFLQFLPSGNLT